LKFSEQIISSDIGLSDKEMDEKHLGQRPGINFKVIKAKWKFKGIMGYI
jgi:hypothetical protein